MEKKARAFLGPFLSKLFEIMSLSSSNLSQEPSSRWFTMGGMKLSRPIPEWQPFSFRTKETVASP